MKRSMVVQRVMTRLRMFKVLCFLLRKKYKIKPPGDRDRGEDFHTRLMSGNGDAMRTVVLCY